MIPRAIWAVCELRVNPANIACERCYESHPIEFKENCSHTRSIYRTIGHLQINYMEASLQSSKGTATALPTPAVDLSDVISTAAIYAKSRAVALRCRPSNGDEAKLKAVC